MAVARRRVLLVDDNVDAARTLGMMLELLGNEVHHAYDGLQAVAAAGTLEPHVILMDIGLPELNGLDAARQIRAQPRGASILLIALTGWGDEDDKQRTREAGFDLHLVKPVSPTALGALLDERVPMREGDT